jgi:signal transduction histidine kinase
MLDVLQRDVEYSNQIVTDLVEYSGQMKYDFGEISLRSIVEESLNIAKPPHNIQIKNMIHDEKIICDSQKLKRVLVNLIGNACDAMVNGGELTIRNERSGNGVELTISDNGPGLPKEVMETLWKGFFSTKAKGMGLGLAISKQIVNGLGGSISVDSTPTQGTTFNIWLPCQRIAWKD